MDKLLQEWKFRVMETEDAEGVRQVTWGLIEGASLPPTKFLQLLAYAILLAKDLIEDKPQEFPDFISEK